MQVLWYRMGEEYDFGTEQVQVIELLADGYNMTDIADTVDVSYSTVRNWVRDDFVPQGVVDWNGKRGRGFEYTVTDDGYDVLDSYDPGTDTDTAGSSTASSLPEPAADILGGEAKAAVFTYVAEQGETTRDELYSALDAFDNRGLAATLRFLAQDDVITVDDGITLTDGGHQLYNSVADEIDATDPVQRDTTGSDGQDNRVIVHDYIAEQGTVTKNELRVNLDIGNRAIGQNLRHLRDDGAIVETRAGTYQAADANTGETAATGSTGDTQDTDDTELLKDQSVDAIMDGRMQDYVKRRKAQLDEQQDQKQQPGQQKETETGRVQEVRKEKQEIMMEEEDDPLLAEGGQSAMEQDQAVTRPSADTAAASPERGSGPERVGELQEKFGDMFRDDDGSPYVETMEGDWRHDDGFDDRDFTGGSRQPVPRQRLAALTGLPEKTVEAAYIRGMERNGDRSLVEGWDLPEKKESPDVDFTEDTAGYEGLM